MFKEMAMTLSRVGVLAAAYLPQGFQEALLEMARRIDNHETRIENLEKKESQK